MKILSKKLIFKKKTHAKLPIMQRVNFQTGIKLDAFAKFNHKAPK